MIIRRVRRADAMDDRDSRPTPLAEALKRFLKERGLEERVGRAAVITEWALLVGPEIARVATPTRITADGTLFVSVTSHAWMNELSLMEVQLLARLNGTGKPQRVRRIRWELRR